MSANESASAGDPGTDENKPKTEKELKKEAARLAKLEKFKAKQEKQGKQTKTEGDEPRPNPCAKSSTNSFKTGCEASITLQANKSKNGLVVTRSHLDHSNHPLLAGLRVYPENRKITSDDEKEIEKLHTLGVSCQRIREHLEATSGADLESYDVRNKIQKMVAEKEAGKSAEDLIISEFKAMKERDPHSSWDVCKSEDGVAEVITFQTSHMKQLFAKYPEAIFLDATKSVKDIVFGQQKALLKKPVIRTTFENVKEVLVNVYSTVVPKAAKKVQAELEASMGQIFLIDEYGSTIDPNGKKYTTTSTSCTCFTSQSQLLPCRHIFYIRNSKEEVLFRVEDFPKHYLLNTFLEDLSISSSTLPLSNSGVHQMPSVTKPVKMNENEKYRLAFSTVKDICSIMASFDDKKFHHYMANLKNMSELMKEGKHIDMIVEYDGERTLVVDEDFNSSGLPVVTPSVTNEEESLIVNDGIEGTSIFSTRAVSNTEMLPSTSGVPASVTVDEGESSNDSDNSIFYLPTAIKRKGRPKGLSTKKKVRRTCSSAFDAEKVLSFMKGADQGNPPLSPLRYMVF
ncbi:hypothetical protein EGW08_008965 [Elysia chlorotica]|uniref:SWIM-type domain-containing protein n=1 Tax=Elysia chlorotica TaxID=188477 RepID=A0A433TNZ3_ELYCH|nr:hypothetical protein EGW08_008965 [Elysia chlorotica]